MFISIDHDKRPSDYKIHLAKPNKEIIAVLYERHNSTLNMRLGNIFELNFSIPYFIENNDLQMVNNPNVEKIKELMYLKLTWGELEEWFLIDNITESSEDNETMNIQAFSIGYEHKRKRISEFNETAINATEFYTEVLRDSPWTIGEIDSSFNSLFRSFDESGTDRFELIKVGAETFGGVILWDTHNKKISLKEPDNIGEFKGLIVNYDRLMTSLSKTRTTDEMVTRLYVYGNERISIENKNPTSERYIEDYSYFMYPFKRDANKNVLAHSHYMSDDLCHALLDNQELRKINEPKIKTLQGNIESRNTLLSSAMIDLDNAEFTLMTAKGLLDIAKAVNDTELITQRKAEVASAETTLKNKETAVKNLRSEIEGLQKQITDLQKAISIHSFTKELIDELEPYIIEKEIEDSRYIDEGELFEFAKDKFAEIREPRVVIETGIEGLMNSVEEQYYWDKLNLGDTMQVKQKRMNINYKSKIIEINVNLDTSDAEVKIANFTENVDNLDKFISILYSSESNSTVLNNNKHKWDSVVDMRDEVTQLRESEIDATKKRITAGVNESVEIGDRGIVITTPSFPNEMIIMQAGVIALSEDGGNNWKTSVTPRGVIADTIIGKLVASNNLIVTNDSGSMVLDGTGLTVDADSIKIMSGGSNPKNIIEDWNNMIIDMDNFADDNVLTPYEKSQILHQWNMISDAHTKLIESFIDNMGNETAENPYPLEYDIYLETYERLKNFLFSDKQSDGYSMLDSSRMQFVSPVSSESYRSTLTNYMTAKDDFILVIPMEYTNASIRVLEEGIFLEYVKSDELVASLNLSEEGVRIDGKLLSINSETRFRDDVVMDAGVIKSADNAIRIDLNAGTIDLSRPLTINAVPVATKEDIENIEMTYTPILSNDTANIPTDENGNNGNYYTANTEITIYQQSKDDTINWTITADKSAGITGSLSGNKYTVTNMTTNVGYVDLIAKKSGKTLVKRFTLAKAKDGQAGRIPPMLSLSSTGQIMTFDSGNNPTPSSQEIQVVAKVNNYEGQVSWKIEKFNGNSLVETTTPSKNPQNTIMINQSIMTGNITSVRVTAYDLDANSNFSDYITIYKLKESMDGVGIESITEYYLATSQATGVTSSTSGFTTTIQTMTDVNRYLWNYEKIKYTDGTDKNTVPVIIGVHGQKGDIGEDGRSIASITEHYLATSLESGVSRGTSGWSTAMQQTDDDKRYLWNYETISWNKAPLTTYVEPVIIGVYGKKGDSGENAELLYLTSTSEIMTFEHDNTPNPSSQVITFVANLQNVTGTATFTAIPYNGATAMTAISMGGSGNSRTITQSQFPINADRIVVTATIRGLTDYVTIVKLKNGKIGSDGVKGSNAVVGYLTNESITLGANSSGVVASFANANGTFKVFDGLTDKTSSATFSKVSQTGAVATINSSTGLYSISSMSADNAIVVLRAVYNGVTIEKSVSLSKSKSGQDGKNSITALLTNEAMTLPATTSGTVTDFSSANGIFEVFDGTTKVNATAVYSVAYQSNITVSINQSGAYLVSAMSVGASVTQGTATLRAVYNGVTLEKALNVSKALVGESGSSATSYWVTSSTNVVKKDVQNNIVPTSITFSGFQKVGTNNPTAYSGRFIISTSVNGKDYTNVYTSSSNQTTYEYVVPKDVNFIKARFYQSGGTTILLDEQTIPVLVDAEGIDKKYEGQSLLDKTEILSGTEIYTDKADDSVVHVDIDGKSAGGGSGKNIVLGLPYQSYSSNLAQGRVRVPVNFDSMKSNQGGKITFSFEARSSVSANAHIYVLDLSNYTSKGYHVNNLSIGVVGTEWKTYTVTGNINTNIILDDISEFTLAHNSANPHDIEVRNIQIEIGSTATEYEPPAPTPDYPIEIHSANDFDVVSSVGGRNLAEGGNVWADKNTVRLYKPAKVTEGRYYRVMVDVEVENGVAGTQERLGAEFSVSYMDGTTIYLGAWHNITNNTTFKGTVVSGLYQLKTAPIKSVNYANLHAGLISGDVVRVGNFKVEEVFPPNYQSSIYSTAPEDISYDTHTPTLYKTNILLSEPLRSVGDVKDRLFRDNDGLWKVERNVGEKIFTGGESFTTVQPTDNTMIRFTYTPLASETRSGYNNVLSNYFKPNKEAVFVAVTEESIDTHPSSGNMEFFIKKARLSTDDSAGFKSWLMNKHIAVQYLRDKAIFETLPQVDQDKINNIASYEGSNYLYTIVDKTNILPSYVRDNLKPTLHATFKGGGWYARFETEERFSLTNKSVDNLKNETIPALKDGLLNSSEKEVVKQSLNVVSADKKGIDMQYTTVYANTALTGTFKTNLNSAKVSLNTAFTNLQSAINAVLGVGDGTRITDTQMTLVTTRLNEYGTALSTYNQRYEQAQDAISTEKKRLGDAYALAQATLAETQAKAHADGKITAEEQRAIADAQAKLNEAKKYVDDLEIGGRNLILKSAQLIENTAYNIATYDLAETIANGETVTVTLKGELATTKTSFTLYNSGGNVPLATLDSKGSGIYQKTFNWAVGISSNTQLWVYTMTNAQTGTSKIEWIKLEKGNKATDWTEAPEDVEERIGSKADIEVIDNLKNDLQDYAKQEDYLSGIGEVNSSLEAYKSLLETIERDLKGERDENGEFVLDADGNPVNVGAIKEIEDIVNRETLIVNNLGELSERWNFIGTNIIMASEGLLIGETGIDESGKELLITGIRISKDRVDFIENGTIVAEITGQRMKINRAIFVQSISVGEHKIETLSGGHTIWTWSPIV